MNVGILALKCKLISLALEAQGIRFQERRVNKQLHKLLAKKDANPDYIYGAQLNQSVIHHHRITAVRGESRLTHWAYAYLRGQSHEKCEAQAGVPLNPKEVERLKAMVGRFSYAFRSAELERWIANAQARCLEATQMRTLRDQQRAAARAALKLAKDASRQVA